jgi:surfeit locus 1 family protein
MAEAAQRRRPRWLPTLATIAVVALTVSAGIWQTHRASYKRELQAHYEAQSQASPVVLPGGALDEDYYRYRRVYVSGRFDPAHEILLDNIVLHGVPGYEVVTPLKLEHEAAYVLINRGWVASGLDRSLLPEIKTPLGVVRIEGVAVSPSGKYLELSSQTVEGKVWENLNFPRMQEQLPLRVQTLMVTQLNENGDGLVRHWERPDTGIERHIGYAFQWFALALTTLVIYGVQYAKRRKSA